jgi:ubiquitin-protein ligase
MQNQILHPAEHTRRTAQVVRRIGTRYTAGTTSVNLFSITIEVSSFSYPAENGTIRCRIKFYIQHNTLEEQHKSSGESGQELSNRVLTSPTLVNDILKIKTLEFEKKFILEYCSLFSTDKSLVTYSNKRSPPYNTDMTVISGRILPEKDAYCFASFLIQIILPSEYPLKMSPVIFLTPIYHPTVNDDGIHYFSWRYSKSEYTWRPTRMLTDGIDAIINTIDNPDSKYYYPQECTDEYQNNYEKFYEKALQYTLKHGRPPHSSTYKKMNK